MKTPLVFFAAAALTGFALTGCQFFFPTPIEQEASNATAPPKAVRSVGVPFREGEIIRANVFLDSILAGTGELRATRLCSVKNKTAVRVELRASSSGLARMLKSADSKTESLIDLDSGYPISGHGNTTIGDEQTEIGTLFGPSKFSYEQIKTLPEKEPKTVLGELTLPIEQVPHDGESTLGYFRNWRPPPGTTGYVFAIFGRYPWRADLTFVGPEVIVTDHGDEKAVRIEGVAQKLVGSSLVPSENTPKRSFTLWFSDDDRRAPLRILMETSIAKVTVELSSYEKSDVTSDPTEACAPLFDEAKLERGVAEKNARKKRTPAHPITTTKQPVVTAAPPKSDKDTSDGATDPKKPDDHDDDEKEEKDSVDKLLRSSGG